MKHKYGNDFPKKDEYCEYIKCVDHNHNHDYKQNNNVLERLDVFFLKRVIIAIAVLVSLIFVGQVIFYN